MNIEEELPYSVGALLYCPATNERLAEHVAQGAFGKPYSLALCLEDSIGDTAVEQAEAQTAETLRLLKQYREEGAFYLPKIFIRVREPEQIGRLLAAIDASLVTGFVLPKFCERNAEAYLRQMEEGEASLGRRLYAMPILESRELTDLRRRRKELFRVKDYLDGAGEQILNIRVGGNDLCNVFGIRRHWRDTIYDMGPVADILKDIVAVFSRDYVVSGPVWEYFSGEGWQEGLRRELRLDRLNGFVGKTVIHPNQIAVVNESLMVDAADRDDAERILGWGEGEGLMVEKNASSQRMTEVKTHGRWAKRTAILARIYGVRG